MTIINFYDPSTGEVTADKKAALHVTNKGSDNGWRLLGECVASVGVMGRCNTW